METGASRKLDRPAEARTSSQRCHVECSGRARENVDSMPLARVSGFDGRHSADGNRCFDGDHRILLQRLRAGRVSKQLDRESEKRAERLASE